MAKLYFVEAIGYEYNDEVYDRTEGGTAVKAFRKKENAEAECERLNKEAIRDLEYEDWDGPVTEYYRVAEVELADDGTYEDSRLQADEAQKKAAGLVKDHLLKGAREVFGKFPELRVFAWTGYTSYFCDGDVCSYHIRADEPDINGECSYDIRPEPDWLDDACSAICSLAFSVSARDMENAFGDHKRFVFSRAGYKAKLEVEDYTDHG